jgi:hypothetical protein
LFLSLSGCRIKPGMTNQELPQTKIIPPAKATPRATGRRKAMGLDRLEIARPPEENKQPVSPDNNPVKGAWNEVPVMFILFLDTGSGPA